MKQFASFLCLTLLFLSSALSSVPPIPPMPLIPEDCNATVFQAGLALDEINKDRDESYVFALYRVADAHRQPVGSGNIYYFTIDVVETDCHIVSRKSWKDCNIGPVHDLVFGQCKVIFYLSLPWRRVKLYSYNCILSPVPKSLISSMCPDCLIGSESPLFEPIADTIVAKYNKESNNTHYYKVYMVEGSKMQRVGGPSYFMEIIIKETNCSKSETHDADCHFLEAEQARVGVCKGSQIRRSEEDEVSVSCEIYGPKKLGLPRFRHHEGYGKDHGEVAIFYREKFDPSGKIVRLPEDQQRYHKEKHEEKHGHGSPSSEPHDQPTKKPDEGSSPEHAGRRRIPPPFGGPVGTVEYYHMINETDVFPSPSNPVPSHPIVPPGSSPGEEAVEPKHPFVPSFIGPFQDPEPQPFPLHPSDSAGCPSDSKHMLPHIASLLPKP